MLIWHCCYRLSYLPQNLNTMSYATAIGGGQNAEASKKENSKSLKEKTTKAERRALQEAQRAAKVSAKGSTT